MNLRTCTKVHSLSEWIETPGDTLSDHIGVHSCELEKSLTPHAVSDKLELRHCGRALHQSGQQ